MVGITIPTMAYPNIPSVGALAQQEVIRISQTDRTCGHHEIGAKRVPSGVEPRVQVLGPIFDHFGG